MSLNESWYVSIGLVDESQSIVIQWPNERYYVYLVLCERIFLRNQYYGKHLTSNKPKGLKVAKEVLMADRLDGLLAQWLIG